MAYGIKQLRRIQLGREVTPGTIVAASTTWRGEGTLEDTRVVEFPTENIGIIPESTRSYQPMLGGKLTLATTPATFEQILHIFEMGIKTVTPTADGSGSGKIYTYNVPALASTAVYVSPTSSANPFKSYTIEAGDNNQAEVMEFCYVEDFELAWKAGEVATITANIAGRQVVVQAFTASGTATTPTVSELLGSKCKLYIDAIGGTIGTTQITNEILSGSLKVKTGLQAIPTSEGSLVFSFVKGVAPVITLDLTFEHSTFAIAEKAFWRTGTPRLFQFTFQGNALTTSGSNYVYKTLTTKLAGTYEKFSALEDDNGDDTITATIRGQYSATAGLFCQIIVVNELASVP